MLAEKIAKGLVDFSNNPLATNVLTFVIGVISPESKAGVTIARNFILEASPVLFKAFKIMDASDNTNINEDNIVNVCDAFNKLGKVADQDTLKKMVTKFIDNDGKLSFMEALTIIESNK